MTSLEARATNDGGQRVAKRRALPRWHVTASHRTVRRVGRRYQEMPYGPSHVRKLGAAFTACGRPALNWPLFWDLSVNDPDDMCAECRWTARVDDELPAARS